jgi:hypothetical protein
MACLIDRKRDVSPTARAQVSAVIGPTPGMVLNRLSLSLSSGTRSSDRKSCIQPDRSVDVFPAEAEQRPDALADLLVGRHQVGKVAHAVQPQLVVAHSGLHQQAGYAVCHFGFPDARNFTFIRNSGVFLCLRAVSSWS